MADHVELRGNTPRKIIDVLDAVSSANDVPRIELVNEILGEWVEKKLHEVECINRVMRRNPSTVDAKGKGAE